METIQDFCFFLFTSLALLGSFGVVFFPNLVYAAFFLGVTLVCVAGFYLLLNADFLAGETKHFEREIVLESGP